MNDARGYDGAGRGGAPAIDRSRLLRLLQDTSLADDALIRELRSMVASSGPREPARAREDGGRDDDCFMVGSSPAMRAVFDQIRRCAASNAPVLIAGESGTGKELAARAIHERSARSAGPLVVINCAALPPSLIASELFGYEKGAFTGAVGRKTGRLEDANRGTVFLDEIGDLSPELQGHLLRFLQEGTIERVGGNRAIELDVRIIAASHLSLPGAVARGAFRQDLFYRLHVLTLEMPALRDRADDRVLLATYFLRQIEDETGAPAHELDASAIASIESHPWPGNVRELIACMRRAVVFANGPYVTARDLGILSRPTLQNSPTLAEERAREAEELRAILTRNRFNIRRAAEECGFSRVTMYRRMRELGIVNLRRRRAQLPCNAEASREDVAGSGDVFERDSRHTTADGS